MEQNKRKQDYEENWDLDNIRHLIYDSPGQYIVFIDDSLDVDWKTSEEFDAKGHTDAPRFNVILSKVAEIECIPNDHLKESIRLNFKRMLGEAVARALEGQYDNAEEMLEKARKYVFSRNAEEGRCWHLESSSLVTLIFVILGLVFWLFRNAFIGILGNTCFYVLLSTCGGCVGALFSIYLRIGKVDFDSAAGKKLLFMEGGSRVIAGGIAGMLIALFIHVGLVFSMFVSNKHVAMFTFAVVAGVSERWVPSIITQFTAKNATAKLPNEGGNVGEKAYSSNL